MVCRSCATLVSLRDVHCAGCGRFLVPDRPRRIGLGAVGVLGCLVYGAGAIAFGVLREAQDYQRHVARSQARLDVETVQPVAERWVVDHAGDCPTMTGLREAGELSRSSKLTDPWDRTYRIECSGGAVRVSSDGPDGEPATADDVTLTARGLPPT